MMEQKSSLDQTSSESFFFFNPRTPCGVRQTGGEITWTRCWFQSTHSLRSATSFNGFHIDCPCVSIHALLAECDLFRSPLLSDARRFNPRTPCGVRRGNQLFSHFSIMVSIHALLAECDLTGYVKELSKQGFNPRTPCGVRQGGQRHIPPVPQVSIHALLAECDR